MKKWVNDHKKSILLYGGAILYFIVLIAVAVISGNKEGQQHLDPKFFNTPIRWYAIFILSGVLIAALFSFIEFKKAGINTDYLYDGLLIFLPLAIIGARLYYVLFSWLGEGVHYDSFWDVINPASGGLAIHGAIIVVVFGLIWFTKCKKISYWFVLDVVAPGFLIGQIMGRWGNFMNHEAYGPAIKSQWVIDILPNFITKQMTDSYDPNIIYHPTFLYEGMWNLLGLVILFIIRRKRILKLGDMVALYLMWYGVGRGLLIEPFRQDPLLFFGIRVNVVSSLGLFLLGGIAIIFGKRYFIKDQEFYFDFIQRGGHKSDV